MSLCAKCQVRLGTEKFGDSAVMVARGYFQMWCRRCVLVTQIAYAAEAVTRLDKLRDELESLDRVASATGADAPPQKPASPSPGAYEDEQKKETEMRFRGAPESRVVGVVHFFLEEIKGVSRECLVTN